MKIKHISASKRSDGNRGGVEKFAWYLQGAIGCEILEDDEYDGSYDGDTLFIVDGNHGANIPDDAPIISVAHGTWAGLHRRWIISDIGDVTEKSQIERWKKPNVKVVSISPGVTYELTEFCGVEPYKCIPHGIYTDIYRPVETKNQKPVVIHVAQGNGKGLDKMEAIQNLVPEFEIRYLNAEIGEEPFKFAQGDMFLHASLSDGNSYACLEAMSCDLPSVVTNVGLFHDFDDIDIGMVVNYNCGPETYAAALKEVWKNREKIHPREWMAKNSTYNRFKKQWEDLIEEFTNSK